jgi:hypothetical protein
MIKTAVFSPDRRYRYALWRIWDERKPICMFIGLNPSTANEDTDDPTTIRCMGFAGSWGFGGHCMGNMFGLVSSDPHALRGGDPIGPENDAWLAYLAAHSAIVVACWGQIWKDEDGRREAVIKLVLKTAGSIDCLGITKTGQPKHPLFLPRGTKPVPFPGRYLEDYSPQLRSPPAW